MKQRKKRKACLIANFDVNVGLKKCQRCCVFIKYIVGSLKKEEDLQNQSFDNEVDNQQKRRVSDILG